VKTRLGFFRWFGPKRSQALRFIGSDMWKAYLRVVNWFRARGQLSAGAVEGLNGKVRVITKRACGFRTYRAVEVAPYHNLGRLPEPDFTHRFC
jgi:transposase